MSDRCKLIMWYGKKHMPKRITIVLVLSLAALIIINNVGKDYREMGKTGIQIYAV